MVMPGFVSFYFVRMAQKVLLYSGLGFFITLDLYKGYYDNAGSMKVLRNILKTVILLLVVCNVAMYLTGYSAFDDWRIDRLIGRTWAKLISMHLFMIVAAILGVVYWVVDRIIKKRTRDLLLKEFE